MRSKLARWLAGCFGIFVIAFAVLFGILYRYGIAMHKDPHYLRELHEKLRPRNDLLDVYGGVAASVFEEAGVAHEGQTLDKIECLLYCLSSSDIEGKVRVSGMRVRAACKVRMDVLGSGPKDEFMLELSGTRTTGPVKVWLDDDDVELVADPDDATKYLGLQAAFVREPWASEVTTKPPYDPEAVFGRLAVNQPGYRVTWAQLTGSPLFEEDLFVDNNWTGTFGIYSTEADARPAILNTFPSIPNVKLQAPEPINAREVRSRMQRISQ
jgi:hypothetical protein